MTLAPAPADATSASVRQSEVVLSVVIPTLNEAATISHAIASAQHAGAHEVIVVDGGSEDATVSLATTDGANVIASPPGRGPQLNTGAAAASGNVVLFLHADCCLPPDTRDQIAQAFEDPAIVAGGFEQRIDADASRYRSLESGNAWRAKRLGWVYGDQALFVRRDVFEQLGGFPDIPLMEDLAFSKQLKRTGRLALLEGPVTISARRWQRTGVVTQTLRNWSFVVLYHLGVSPQRLARWY